MIPAIKSELRKLVSLRSTYLIPLFAFSFLTFISFYVEGFQSGPSNIRYGAAKLFLALSLPTHAGLLAVFAGVVALLVMTHEYRYNTIMYTMTATKRRGFILAAKLVSVALYTFMFMVVGTAVALGGMVLGLHIGGATLPHQDISFVDYFLKSIVFGEAWAFFGLLLATLMRNQVSAIVVLLIEPLLGLVLKENIKYLPFTALSQLLVNHSPAAPNAASRIGIWEPWQGALLFLIYLIVGWLIGWILFIRRDAN